MKILLTICARGGSKGIPGKNIRDLNGKPLLEYTIKCAQEFAKKYGAKVSLSTDSAEIKAVAESLGLFTDYKRPDNLASDSAGKIGAIQHLMEFEEALNGKAFEFIIDLDVTSPMRTQEDLQNALDLIQESPDALNIFSVSPASRNPYFNMVEKTESGYVRVVKGDSNIKSRQQAPVVYDMNASFYIFRRKFFENGHKVSTTEKSLAYVMPHICFDLDEPHDFTIMEIMLKQNLLNFQF